MLSFGLLWVLNPATKMFIQLFMNANYHSAAEYISFLYLGTVFQSFASFYGVGYLRDRKTNQAASSSIYGAVVNALINIVLIKFIGLQAASISTFLGFLVMWLIRERQNRRELGVVIDIKLFLQLFLITILLSIIECFTDIYIDSILLVLGGIMFLSVNRNAMNAVRVKFFQRYR